MILFTATNISDEHQTRLKTDYPDQTFIFCHHKSDIEKHIKQAEIVVTYGGDLTEDLLTEADNLKWIQVISAGVDGLPFDTIQKQGVSVTNVSGIHKIPMSEYAISMLLNVYRQEKTLHENQAQFKWSISPQPKEVTGKTMIVLGTGAIGQETARLAKAFQMKTIGLSRSGHAVKFFDETYQITKLDSILPKADFVISVLPSTNETKGLLKMKHFEIMKDKAVFLNMGRGDLVRSKDILQAVRRGEVAHAILDVFEQEPLPNDDPLWKEDQITITPHLSGSTPYYQDRALDIFEHNLQIYIEGTGTYKNNIDMTRGY